MQSDVGPSLLHVLAGGTACPCCGAPSAATAGPLLTRLNPPPLQAMRMRRPAGLFSLVVLLMSTALHSVLPRMASVVSR
jgi:hypothetical protein